MAAEPAEGQPVPDVFGRQLELVHAVICRLHHGPPMSKWDWYALMGMCHLLGVEVVEPDPVGATDE